MTGKKTEEEMLKIALAMKEELQARLCRLDKTQVTAAKAYKISLSMIEQASKMVSMRFSGEAYDEKYYKVREDRVFRNPLGCYFTEQKDWFDGEQNLEKKQAFLVYAHGVQMVRMAFLEKKAAELEKAKAANAVEAVFEHQMAIDSLSELLDKWESWWKSMGGIS